MAEPGVLAVRVREWLTATGWQVLSTDGEDGTWQAEVGPAEADPLWPVLVVVREDDQQVAVVSVPPEEVPDDRRDAVARALWLADHGLVIGNLEMSPDEGVVRVRTALELGEADLDELTLRHLLERLLERNLELGAVYFDALSQVLAGGDPDEAVRAAEQSA